MTLRSLMTEEQRLELEASARLEKEANEKSMADAIAKLNAFDKMTIAEKINEFISLRMSNEYVVLESLKDMVLTKLKDGNGLDEKTITHMSQILSKSKDSVDGLVKVKQLLEGKATSITDVNFVEKLRKARSRLPDGYSVN